MKRFKSLILFLASFVFGVVMVYKMTDQIIVDREIASINQSRINSLKFVDMASLQKDLIKKIKISTTTEKEKIIVLEGFSSQICKSYPRVELFFDAYGVSVSGEPMQFKVSAECVPAQDPADIAAIKIPYEKLLNEKIRNAEFKFSGYEASFQFINRDNEMAKTWILNRVVFKSSTESKIVQIDRSQNEQPIVMEF